MDYLHREGQLGEDLLVRERRQEGMCVSVHGKVISEYVERGQK